MGQFLVGTVSGWDSFWFRVGLTMLLVVFWDQIVFSYYLLRVLIFVQFHLIILDIRNSMKLFEFYSAHDKTSLVCLIKN